MTTKEYFESLPQIDGNFIHYVCQCIKANERCGMCFEKEFTKWLVRLVRDKHRDRETPRNQLYLVGRQGISSSSKTHRQREVQTHLSFFFYLHNRQYPNLYILNKLQSALTELRDLQRSYFCGKIIKTKKKNGFHQEKFGVDSTCRPVLIRIHLLQGVYDKRGKRSIREKSRLRG